MFYKRKLNGPDYCKMEIIKILQIKHALSCCKTEPMISYNSQIKVNHTCIIFSFLVVGLHAKEGCPQQPPHCFSTTQEG